MSNRKSIFAILLILPFILGASPLSMLLESEKKKDDLAKKATARFNLVEAHKKYFDRNISRSREYINEVYRLGYYIIDAKRLESRLDYLQGEVEGAWKIASKLDSETGSVMEDRHRTDALAGVRRFLRLSVEQMPLRYKVAAVIDGEKDARRRFISPSNVEIDPRGKLLISSFSTNDILVLTKGLAFSRRLKSISNPFASTLDMDGNVYATSFGEDMVYRYNARGNLLGKFGGKGSDNGKFYGPEGILVTQRGYIYVVDSGNHRIQKFSPAGDFLLSFGSRGLLPGEFMSPRQIIQEGKELTVLSYEGRLIQKFDVYGNFLNSVPVEGISRLTDFAKFEDWYYLSTAAGNIFRIPLKGGKAQAMQDGAGNVLKLGSITGIDIDKSRLFYLTSYPSKLHVLQPAALDNKIIMNIMNMKFNYYPFIAVVVNIYNSYGAPVTGLTKKNFSVEEEKIRVSPVSVTPFYEAGPHYLNVVLDAGEGHDKLVILLKDMLGEMSRKLPTPYYMAISKGKTGLLDFTDNPYMIRKSIKFLGTPSEGTLLDSIRHVMESYGSKRGRRNIALITQSKKDLPSEEYSKLVVQLMNRNISLFVLHLDDLDLPNYKKLCNQTGGEFRMMSLTSIPDFIFDLLSSKTSGYFVVYSSPLGKIQRNSSVDMKMRVFYLDGKALDRHRYYAP